VEKKLNRTSMISARLRCFLVRSERLLFIVGTIFLGTYVAAQLHAEIASRIELWRFQLLQQVALDEGFQLEESQRYEEKVDFTLWAEKRIEEYKRSLLVDWDPPLGLLRIPRIGLEVVVMEGTDELTLNRGVGRIAGTAEIGEEGNLGIAGHRDGLFRGLRDLRVGDNLELVRPEGRDLYEVKEMDIVEPEDVYVLQDRTYTSLTLVTCYPFYYVGHAPYRYIVHGALKERFQKAK
jgi:sortase A